MYQARYDHTQFIGSAVFKNGVMIDKLNGQETRIVNILDDTTEIEELLATIKDPFSDNQMVAVRIMKTENNKIKMNLKGPKPKIQITVPLQFEILTNPTNTDYAKSKKNQETFKKSIIDQTESLFEGVLKKTQTELKGAPYPLSTYARKYFGTIEEFNKFNWEKSYPEADISVKADIQIVDYGKQSNILKERGRRVEYFIRCFPTSDYPLYIRLCDHLMERKTEIWSLYGLYSILSHHRAPFLFYFQTLKFANILRYYFGGCFL